MTVTLKGIPKDSVHLSAARILYLIQRYKELTDEITYHEDKAKEALEHGDINVNRRHWNSCMRARDIRLELTSVVSLLGYRFEHKNSHLDGGPDDYSLDEE